MPFHYDLKLPNELPECTLVECLVSKASYIQPGTAICILENDEAQYVLRNAGRGVLREWLSGVGEKLGKDQTIERMDADGEDIPYNKPYVLIAPL